MSQNATFNLLKRNLGDDKMEKRKSLRELKSIVKERKEELERNLDDIVQYSDLSNPQVKEIIAKLQGEIEVMDGIILYCTTGESYLI